MKWSFIHTQNHQNFVDVNFFSCFACECWNTDCIISSSSSHCISFKRFVIINFVFLNQSFDESECFWNYDWFVNSENIKSSQSYNLDWKFWRFLVNFYKIIIKILYKSCFLFCWCIEFNHFISTLIKCFKLFYSAILQELLWWFLFCLHLIQYNQRTNLAMFVKFAVLFFQQLFL